MASLRAEGVGMKTLQLSGYREDVSMGCEGWGCRGGQVCFAWDLIPIIIDLALASGVAGHWDL